MVYEGPVTVSVLTDAPRDGARIFVIDGGSSLMAGLPAVGTVTLGRAPDCEIRLADPACSRRHARIHVDAAGLTLEDLGSHNGTRVNGERVTQRHPLTSDDVISIGPIRLVIHESHPGRRPVALEPSALRGRLAEEVERAPAYDRPLAIAVITVERCRGAVAAIAGCLRVVDAIGVLDERHLVVVMPELGPGAARALGEQVLAALAESSAAVGLAGCPRDACTAEALIAAARAAATDAGAIREAADCVEHLELAGSTMIVADAVMLHIYDLVRRLAPSDLAVLIAGETGAGKEHVAHALHAWSARSARPFVAINCASLPETLVESELFGYERGAFTGATASKLGHLEAAHGGTVFFDEIGELPLVAQAKLLRALESRRVMRLGGLKEIPIDVRIVAATNRNLEAEVREGRFREDLFFRLSGAMVLIPPLRDRPRELAILAQFLLDRACAASGRPPPELSPAALAVLARYRWPGNVRELKNEMDYVAAMGPELVVEPWHLSERIAATPVAPTVVPRLSRSPGATFRPLHEELRELERRRMIEALVAADGVQKRAAELIGMPLRTFTMKYKQHGLGDR